METMMKAGGLRRGSRGRRATMLRRRLSEGEREELERGEILGCLD